MRPLGEAERSVVDIETLQHTNEQLISTLDEVLNIQREGAQSAGPPRRSFGRIEGQLKQKAYGAARVRNAGGLPRPAPPECG